jgi:hypothetical protein
MDLVEMMVQNVAQMMKHGSDEILGKQAVKGSC